MSKTEYIQTANITFNFNQIQLPELCSLKRTKSDRIQLPTEPQKKIKNYFNLYNFSTDNMENINNSSLNNSQLDSSENNSTHDNYESEKDKQNDSCTFLNHHQFDDNQQQQHAQSNICNSPQHQIIDDEEPGQQSAAEVKNDIHFSFEGHCINYEERSFNNVFSDENQNVQMIIGYLCLAFAAALFTFTLFSIFFAPFLQPTTHNLIEFLRTDNFYCFLIPLSIPVMTLTIYMNWLSMKYFKHS